MSFDVPWSPDCTYGRCYDALGLSKILDFLVIMAYDEQIQYGGKCIAKATSPLNQTTYGKLNSAILYSARYLGLFRNRNTRNRRYSCSLATYSVFRINRILFRSFCYQKQNERNSVPFLLKTECYSQKKMNTVLFRVILFRNNHKRTRPWWSTSLVTQHFSGFTLSNILSGIGIPLYTKQKAGSERDRLAVCYDIGLHGKL